MRPWFGLHREQQHSRTNQRINREGDTSNMEWTMTANAPGQVCLMQGNEAIVRGAVETASIVPPYLFFK